MKYIEMIETRVKGIPAIIGVKSFDISEGSYNRNDVSDADFYGTSSTSYDILTTRGKHAPWLERKLSPVDRGQVVETIFNFMS